MNQGTIDGLCWYGQMVAVAKRLSKRDLQSLDHFERNRSDELTTSDWPGWIPLIGTPPWKATARPRCTNKRPVSHGRALAMFKRDDHRCRHCGTEEDLGVDHVIPVSKGGPSDLDNLQVLCRSCNSRKGVRV
jgi:5-methylcytosine-specific restriction endonuclease McrA